MNHVWRTFLFILILVGQSRAGADAAQVWFNFDHETSVRLQSISDRASQLEAKSQASRVFDVAVALKVLVSDEQKLRLLQLDQSFLGMFVLGLDNLAYMLQANDLRKYGAPEAEQRRFDQLEKLTWESFDVILTAEDILNVQKLLPEVARLVVIWAPGTQDNLVRISMLDDPDGGPGNVRTPKSVKFASFISSNARRFLSRHENNLRYKMSRDMRVAKALYALSLHFGQPLSFKDCAYSLRNRVNRTLLNPR